MVLGLGRQVSDDLQIPICKCSPHAQEHVCFQNRQNQLASPFSWTFHIHINEEAYCPSHQLQPLEAA